MLSTAQSKPALRMSQRPHPSVRYLCHCSNADVGLDETNTQNLHEPLSLSRLYYCSDCVQLSCDKCVQKEVVCYYCPQCLYETAPNLLKGTAAFADPLKCTRSCLECPECDCILSVVGTEDSNDESEKLMLKCYFCHWDSSKTDLWLDKPTNISRTFRFLA